MNLFNFIKSNLSILDVVGDYSTLKKAGLYWKGQCPFHNEKTASFTVSPHKEIYYCFGCQSGGDVISFIARVENCSPIEAAKLLVERYQLNPPEEIGYAGTQQNSSEDRKQYYELCRLVSAWCHENLIKSPAIVNYLAKRGFNRATIDYFNIGYFPGGITSVKNLIGAMAKHQILPSDLLDANILSEGKSMMYSPFEERIMFPIRDHLGRMCGFGGRIYKEGDERPKYYNSRENEFFSKGSLVFGLDLAKKKIQETEQAFLVEGYTDCMAMVQHGYTNTIATLGTACTPEHLKQLSRYAQHLYVLYDADNAGHQAILRLTEMCWQVSLELHVICLPSKEDPASFLASGNSLNPLIENAQDIFLFFINSLGNQFGSKALSEKIALVRRLIATIHNIDDPLKRDILLQKASKVLEVPLESMQKELARTVDKREISPIEPPPVVIDDQGANLVPKLEKRIFCAIINNMKLFNIQNEKYLLEYLPNPLRDILNRLKLLKNENAGIDFIHFFDKLNEHEKQYVSKLLLEHEEDTLPETFEHLLLQLHKKNWKVIVHTITTKLAEAKKMGDQENVERIMQDFLNLKQAIVGKNII